MKDGIQLTNANRKAIARQVYELAEGWWVSWSEERRTDPQSRKFHALCGDVAKQKTWMGRSLTKDQWKVLFISGHAVATKRGADMVPGLEGEFVNIRESSATMSKSRKASLLEYCLAWCAQNEVRLSATDSDQAFFEQEAA